MLRRRMLLQQARLPSNYKEVRWIESTNGQYIDTGVSAPNGYTASMKFEYLSFLSGYNVSIGAENSSVGTSRNHGLIIQNNNLYLGCGGTNHDLSTKAIKGELLNIEWSTKLGANEVYATINGVTHTFTESNPRTSHKIFLFALNKPASDTPGASGRAFNYTNARLWYLKMYDYLGVLIRDFVPCYRLSDDVIGLYDLVEGVFYTNKGSGAFKKGPDVLPSEYQEVKWIQSKWVLNDQSTTSYIILPRTMTSQTNIKINCLSVDAPSSMRTIFGYEDSYSNRLCFRQLTGTNYRILSTTNANMSLSGDISGQFSLANAVLNNTSYPLNSLVGTSNVCLFAHTYQGTPYVLNSDGTIRMYNFEWYEGSTEVMELIPCYRKIDGVIGMYDLVNGVFYDNDGTGTFTKGDDV